MLNDTMIIELGIWLVAAIIAGEAKSQVIYRACDFWLIFVLSGHNWRITIPVFIVLFLLLRLTNFVGLLIHQAVVPELRHMLRDELRDKSGNR
ncbi:hypothetical protein IJT17_10090 [bacterium]|nr:hypothetical protein [bacterium]